MGRIIQIAKVVALLSVLPVAIFVCIFLRQLTATTAELQHTAKAVNTTVTALPATVDRRIELLQTDVLKKIDTVQDKLNREVNYLASKADTRIGSVQTDLFASVNGIRTDVNAQLTTTNKSVSTITTAYANIPAQIGIRYERDFNKFFDCQKNQLCLQGQASDTMFAVRDASRSTSLAMSGLKTTLPKMEKHALTVSNTLAVDIPKITTNFSSITANIDRLTKPRWYDRLLGYGLNGVIMYRNLNPATDVSIKGAQVVTGAITNSIVGK